jgi:hypothetical protein
MQKITLILLQQDKMMQAKFLTTLQAKPMLQDPQYKLQFMQLMTNLLV